MAIADPIASPAARTGDVEHGAVRGTNRGADRSDNGGRRADHGEIHARWLSRLRWGAIAGQASTVALVELAMGIRLPVGALAAVIAAEVGVNLLTALMLRRGRAFGPAMIYVLLICDVAALTALLYLSGGPANPFNFLYLVYLAVAALVLPPGWIWPLVGLSIVCFGALFVVHRPLAAGGEAHGMSMDLHLLGMWVAFAVAAFFVTLFVGRTASALHRREQQLRVAREREHRAEKLASLSTLAAGAAHELSTPLSTIALAAKELERGLGGAEHGELAADATLIRSQVDRCRGILAQLSADSGHAAGEQSVPVSVAQLLDRVLGALGQAPVERAVDPAVAERTLSLPVQAVARAVRAVVSNAIDASAGRGMPVAVVARDRGAMLEIVVRDRGEGMSAEQLERATEPFFSTKEPGRGMGLGLFLAQSVVRSLGGTLQISSQPHEGTTVTLGLPWAARASSWTTELEA